MSKNLKYVFEKMEKIQLFNFFVLSIMNILYNIFLAI